MSLLRGEVCNDGEVFRGPPLAEVLQNEFF